MEGGEAKALAREVYSKPEPAEALANETGMPLTATMKLLARADYGYFGIRYLPHYFTFPFSRRFHTEFFDILRAIETHETALPTVIAAGRDFGKSVCGNLLLPLHAMHYPSFIFGHDGSTIDMSKRYIAYIQATVPMAMRPLKDLSTELETNERLINDFGNMHLDASGRRPTSRTWAKTAIETSRGHFVEAHGRRSQFRGMRNRFLRVSLLVGDDLDGEKSALSARQRTADVRWLNTALMNTIDARLGNALFLGTLSLHPRSMFAQLIEFGNNNGWTVRVWPAYEDTDKGRVYLWKERYGEEWVKEKLQTIPMSAFEGEFLQNPNADSIDIKPEDFTYYSMKDIEDRLHAGKMIVINGVDPGCRTKEQHDPTAIVPVAFDSETGLYYVLHAQIARLNFAGKISAIIDMHVKNNAFQTAVEDVQAQVAVKEAVDAEARRTHVVVNTRGMSQHADKKLRISRLIGPIKAGTIRFLHSVEHAIIIDQFTHLYTCDHDDGADALEIAIRAHEDRLKLRHKRGKVRAHVS